VTASEIWTVVLSSLALTVSVISLVWQFVRAKRDEPEVIVSGSAGFGIKGEAPEDTLWMFTLTVTNVGRSAVTIDELGWLIRPPGGSAVLLVGGTISADLPLRLEANDSRTWDYSVPARGTRFQDAKGWPQAKYVQRPSRRDRRRHGMGGHHRSAGHPQVLRIPPDWDPKLPR
jgi:hypothetical protein